MLQSGKRRGKREELKEKKTYVMIKKKKAGSISY
jgi:hypothetical protein